MHRWTSAITAAGILVVLAGCAGNAALSGVGRDIPSAIAADERLTPDRRVTPTPTPNPIAISIDCAMCAGDGSQAHPFIVPFRSQNVFLTASDARHSVGFSLAMTSDNHDHACLRLDQDPSTPVGSGTVRYLIDTLGYFDCTPRELASFALQDTPDPGVQSAIRTVYIETSAGSPTPPPSVFPAGCPPTAAGFGDRTCPAIEMRVVGGGALNDPNVRAEPPRGAVALLFAADGSFLSAERGRRPLSADPAFELDVRTDHFVEVDDLAKYQWTIFGGLYDFQTPFHPAFTIPVGVRLISVQRVQDSVNLTGGGFLASDADGKIVGFGDVESPFTFQVTPGTERPVTLLMLPSMPQSHCGNCWVTLLH